MNKIEMLRALSAAKVAYIDELNKRGISITDWDSGTPGFRRLYVQSDDRSSSTFVGEITYTQSIYEEE